MRRVGAFPRHRAERATETPERCEPHEESAQRRGPRKSRMLVFNVSRADQAHDDPRVMCAFLGTFPYARQRELHLPRPHFQQQALRSDKWPPSSAGWSRTG
jgi:hypothetical protein